MPPEPGLRRADRGDLLLFAAAIFASAFLIFLVQPMVGKRILPWFGGAPAVWTLCLAFYQTTLFAGYAYAHGLIRWAPPAYHPFLHGLLLAGAFFALPVLPDPASMPAAGADPNRAILTLLTARVALPFLALAATGPLVQAWFARRQPGRSPYPLYAVSNAGSLLALLAYPFLLEPRLPLSATGELWSFAFAFTAVGVLACAWLAGRGGAGASGGSDAPLAAATRPGAAQIALWILLPACAVILLMGVTNELCLDIASVPFLWILPLCVYLVSFILRFGSDRRERRVPYLLMVLAPFALAYLVEFLGEDDGGIFALADSLQGQIATYCLMLFGACMLLHGELHRLRPPAPLLTNFYLCISGGGALGGLFVGLVAPRLFDDYLEVRLGLALACVLLLAARRYDSAGWLHRAAPRSRWAAATALGAYVLMQLGAGAFTTPGEMLVQERNFFGVLRIQRVESGENEQRHLLSGTTLHGVQFPGSPQRPTSYYGVQTSIGLALAQRAPDEPSAIAVVGLGVGTLAAYGRPGDRFRFYEIDPAVIRIARDARYFSYLANSRADWEIVEGDARVSLASELARDGGARFDFLIIDAFNSDAIPVHLLTHEAFELYGKLIAPDGLIALHTSNRRLDLTPLVAKLGQSIGFATLAIATSELSGYLSDLSVWVFLSPDPGRIRSLAHFAAARRSQIGAPEDSIQFQMFDAAEIATTPLWTDDYSDLYGVMLPIPLGGEDGREP